MNPEKDKQSTFYLMIGAPASGKTTYVSWELVGRGLVDPLDVLNPDEELFEEGEYIWTQRDVGRAWQRVRQRFARICETGRSLVLDATSVERERRKPFLQTAQQQGYRCVAVFCQASRDLLIQRNEARLPPSKRVPLDVIDGFLQRLQPPTTDEGFDEIIHLQASTNPS